MAAPVSLAKRYEAGDHLAVWDEITALGPEVADPRWLADAALVSALTMQRAALNIATIVVRLTMMGYRFGHRYNRNQRRRTIEDLGLRDSLAEAGRDVTWVDDGEVDEYVMGWQQPDDDIVAAIHRLEQRTGRLPLALWALLEFVDAVDLSGSFPDWNPSAYVFEGDESWRTFGIFSDPLNFQGIDVITDVVMSEAAFVDPYGRPPARSVALPVGTNHLLSANRAGDFHSVLLPEEGANPVLQGVFGRPGITLVEYLRVAFAWGGFPGFDFVDEVPREIEVLRRDLLAI